MNIKKIPLLFIAAHATLLMSQKIATTNPSLSVLPAKQSQWAGNPTENGKYVNIENTPLHTFSDIMKWQFSKKKYAEQKKKDTTHLQVSKNAESEICGTEDGIFWLGHATFFIRIHGVTFITDPVFGRPTFIMKRKSILPISLDKLPKIDYILLSHDHRDHCNKSSLKWLKKHSPEVQYFTGLSMKKVVGGWLGHENGQEAGWYQQFNTDSFGFKLTFLPARHWCKRGMFDLNDHLWGAFVIEFGGKTIYFGGDSGYGNHYKELGQLFPNIDYFIVGIGAYEPEWFMERNHSSPEKALLAFQDCNAKFMVPMHYGTFDLSDEPVCYPADVLRKSAVKSILQNLVLIPQLGQNILRNN